MNFTPNMNILKMSNVIRYAGRLTITKENIAEHSLFVSINVIEICDRLNVPDKIKAKALELAILHDYPEVELSDISFIVKRDNPKIAENFDAAEIDFIEKYMPNKVDLFKDMQSKKPLYVKIVKIADAMSVIQYAKKEILLGNQSSEMNDILEESTERVDRLMSNVEFEIKEKGFGDN